MTEEEAKSELMQIYGSLSEEKKMALDVAFKAMEQKSCEDCISRQNAYKCLEIHGDYDTLNKVYEKLKKSPSVNPQKSKTEPSYCDRNICLRNEYNGIGCDECEVTKSQEPYDFAEWVASEIFDEWEYNKDTFAEIACRKLTKLGIVRAKGDEWELVEPQESEVKDEKEI